MAILNGYTTLNAVKNLLDIELYDAIDDSVLSDLISTTSRFIDDKTRRTFYPRIETRNYDVPADRELWLDDDLLSVITITSGDLSLITEYNLQPPNAYPKYAIRIKTSSSQFFASEDDGDYEQVIAVAGWWGFRQYYAQRGWATGTTINKVGGITAADLTIPVVNGTLLQVGQIVKIENEILNISAISGNDVTVLSRGDNGSTAATHADAKAIYIWKPEPDIELACQMIVKNLFHNRAGQNTSGVATVTGAGVVITPEDTPASAMAIIQNYVRIVP